MTKQDIKVTTDSLIFSGSGDALQLLLVKRGRDPFKGQWALPGGFAEDDEELVAAASRELKEETGIHIENLRQLHVFDRVDRDPRFRSISIAHYAIADASRYNVQGADDAAEAQWWKIKDINLEDMAFDHNEVITYALEKLGAQLDYKHF